MLITADTVVAGTGLLRPGWIDVEGDLLRGVGAGDPRRPADLELGAVTVLPGFVDFHRRHGSTTTVASLVSARPAELLAQVRALTEQVRSGVVAGIHLEGPWLAPERCGAHELLALRDPDPAELNQVLAAGGGSIRMVTLAPERTGGLAAIRRIVDAGAVAAVGHTEATYAQTRAAVDAGATVATHLFNAMRPLHHREPGPVLALMEDPRVTLELITDGVHLHPALYRDVSRSVGPDRVALMTDAMAAAGMAGGAYTLGSLAVDVVGGVARVAGTDTIAGSTATMDRVFRYAVTHSGLPRDEALLAAVRQSSVNPARALGLPAAGLAVGGAADLVVLDAQLTVTGVLHRGSWVTQPPRWPGYRTARPRSGRPHRQRANRTVIPPRKAGGRS